MTRMPVPPFTQADAAQKVRLAENAWNGRDPQAVALAYTPDTRWRNRSTFLTGRAAVVAFLTQKWSVEHDYRLIKELWAHANDRIAVRFCYEYHDDAGQWFRAHGNENWAFDAGGTWPSAMPRSMTSRLMLRTACSTGHRGRGQTTTLI